MYSLRFVQNDSIFSMVFIFMLMMTFWRKENFFSSNIHSKSTNSPEESWPYVFKPVESCVVSLISPCFSRKTVMLVFPDQSRFQAYQEHTFLQTDPLPSLLISYLDFSTIVLVAEVVTC